MSKDPYELYLYGLRVSKRHAQIKVELTRADADPTEGVLKEVFLDGCTVTKKTPSNDGVCVETTFVAYRDIRGIKDITTETE